MNDMSHSLISVRTLCQHSTAAVEPSGDKQGQVLLSPAEALCKEESVWIHCNLFIQCCWDLLNNLKLFWNKCVRISCSLWKTAPPLVSDWMHHFFYLLYLYSLFIASDMCLRRIWTLKTASPTCNLSLIQTNGQANGVWSLTFIQSYDSVCIFNVQAARSIKWGTSWARRQRE